MMKPVQSQQNNVKQRVCACCSNVIFAEFEQVFDGRDIYDLLQLKQVIFENTVESL